MHLQLLKDLRTIDDLTSLLGNNIRYFGKRGKLPAVCLEYAEGIVRAAEKIVRDIKSGADKNSSS